MTVGGTRVRSGTIVLAVFFHAGPVLLNPSVPKDALERSGFPARRWTVDSSSSLLSRPWWNEI